MNGVECAPATSMAWVWASRQALLYKIVGPLVPRLTYEIDFELETTSYHYRIRISGIGPRKTALKSKHGVETVTNRGVKNRRIRLF